MTKLDWEKDKRRRLGGQTRRHHDNEKRQAALLRFVNEHQLACFRCGLSGEIRWAKTGVSARGPWAICVDCIEAAS